MDDDVAAKIWLEHSGHPPCSVRRLATGSCNFVYLIDDQNEKSILRITTSEQRDILRGCVYWLETLSFLDLPIPKLKANGIENKNPYVVLNYIKGEDLGAVYSQLTTEQKKSIAKDLWSAQREISKFSTVNGYGHLSSNTDATQKNSWMEVVVAHLQRSREWIRSCGIFEESLVDRVEELLPVFQNYFSKIEPKAFFDDATTKNLLVHEGRFSGIVDLDWICFGDRLYNIALIRMALLDSERVLDYVDYLIEEEQLTGYQMHVLDFYTLVFCVDFIGSTGMQFNKEKAPRVTEAQRKKLLDNFWRLRKKFN